MTHAGRTRGTRARPSGSRDTPDTVARELLAAVDDLLNRASPGTAGLWPRAATLLTRQALEVALRTFWSKRAPGVEACSARAQLLCLGRFIGDEPLGYRAHMVWSVLSSACHYHPYDLAPTREELLGWRDAVAEVVERTERAWR